MSSSIAIPKRRRKAPASQEDHRHHHQPQTPATPGSSGSSGGGGGAGFGSYAHSDDAGSSYTGRTPPSAGSSYSGSAGKDGRYRRPSLLSESISRSEHTVVNVGSGDAMRLITCVRSSQGFDWNQDIFLPSYANDFGGPSELEHKQDPIEEITLTDEEIANMLPS